MSILTLADLQTRLASKLHSSNVNKLNDLYGLLYEAAGNYLVKTDPAETKRTVALTNGLYDSVYDYAAPADLKEDAIIDIRQQVGRTMADNFHQEYGEEFDLYKNEASLAVRQNSGVKTLRLARTATAGVTLNEADSLTSNGTWAAGGNATGLVADTVNYASGAGSLRFDISASGSSAYLENSTMTAVDLTDYLNAGAIFIYVYLPSATVITSVNLRWGSSASDYWTASATTTQDGTAFIVGWNLLRFDWPTTDTGTPVVTAVDYLRVTFNYDGTAVTACRVDNIVARLATPYLCDYYSAYLFRSAAGTWLEKPTALTDLVNLDVTAINGFLYEAAQLVIQEIAGKDSSYDVNFWTKKIEETWGQYRQNQKSERQKRQSHYYRPTSMGRR